MVSDILLTFERQNITIVVILDQSATSDTVDYDVLLTVLILIFVIIHCHGLKNT